MKTVINLQSDVAERLARMADSPPPAGVRWPSGCYGSLGSWLVFVGPSPGGGHRNGDDVPRGAEERTPLWNEDFLRPFTDWSPGFRTSLPRFVEEIIGCPLAQGSARLFAFLNFDWVQNPDAANVPAARMKKGAADVLRLLEQIGPRLIVTLEKRSHRLLEATLRSAGYVPTPPRMDTVFIRIAGKRLRCHRSIDAYWIAGQGRLTETYVVRSPQHPARIFNADYAGSCARAIRSVIEQLAADAPSICVNES